MPKILEENLALGAEPKYDCQPASVITYINRARQVAKMGPGLAEFTCPLIQNVSTGEINRFVGEVYKLNPTEPIRVVRGSGGVAVFAVAADATYRPPTPTMSPEEEFKLQVKAWVLSHEDEVLGWLRLEDR